MASKTGIGCGDPRQGQEKQGPPSGLKGSEKRILLKPDHEAERFVYQTKGVCPPEIHFQTQGDLLKEVRFIGGGCPGNAKLVSRMLMEERDHLFQFPQVLAFQVGIKKVWLFMGDIFRSYWDFPILNLLPWRSTWFAI
jgi:hypothetical protein